MQTPATSCVALALAHLVRFAPVALAGCATVHASASGARNEAGPGAGVEVGGMHRPDRQGPGVFASADVVTGDGAEGVSFWSAVVHGRYSWRLDGHKTLIPFFTAGGGGGLVYEYERASVVEGFAEIGIEWRPTRHFGAALSLRERPAAFIDGPDDIELHNTFQLTLTLVGVVAPAHR